jgi:hypothetical protein
MTKAMMSIENRVQQTTMLSDQGLQNQFLLSEYLLFFEGHRKEGHV